MRSQNRNYKPKGASFWDSAGKGSCVLLLLLALLAVNPVAGLAFAEEIDASIDEVDVLDAQSRDDIESYAATPSTVDIAFNPTTANGTVIPVDASGAKAKVDVKATVRVRNSGGYKVYVGSNSAQLKNGENVIDSVASATTYANLPLNRWGYSFQEGSTVKDSYEAMPETLRGAALYSNTSTNITDETKTFILSFAANIGIDKPAGTYTNQVTMSVVSAPIEVAAIKYSVTYEHTAFSGSLTLPSQQEVESEASSYAFTAAASPGNYFKDYVDGGGGCSHPFTGWSVSQAEYNDLPEYLAGSSITLTKDNPSIVLYPAFRTAASGCYDIY